MRLALTSALALCVATAFPSAPVFADASYSPQLTCTEKWADRWHQTASVTDTAGIEFPKGSQIAYAVMREERTLFSGVATLTATLHPGETQQLAFFGVAVQELPSACTAGGIPVPRASSAPPVGAEAGGPPITHYKPIVHAI